MTSRTDYFSFAVSDCLASVFYTLRDFREKYQNNTYIPDYAFVFQSLKPIFCDASKLALFVSPITQRLQLNTQQGKDDFIQVQGPSQAEITEVTDWNSLTSLSRLEKGEYETVVHGLLRCLGLNSRDDALVWAWMLKLDLYCSDRTARIVVAQRGLRFLWLLCGGKEAFGALVYRIVHPPPSPSTYDALRQILRVGQQRGPADTIMEFMDGHREGPMPTYHNEVFTYPLRLPDRHTGYLPGEGKRKRTHPPFEMRM